MAKASPHEVLGVSPEATASEIRSAFRNKVRASHPDTTDGSEAEGDVVEVVEAYRALIAPHAKTAVGNVDRTGASSVRRVEVRRGGSAPADRLESALGPSCPECSGVGVITNRAACSGCRGAGSVTRLEANRAHVLVCRRCQGRGVSVARDPCAMCGGSGRLHGSRG